MNSSKMGRDEEEMEKLEQRLIELKSRATGHDSEEEATRWNKIWVVLLCIVFFSLVAALGVVVYTEFRTTPLTVPGSDLVVYKGGLYWYNTIGLTASSDSDRLILYRSYKNIHNQSIMTFYAMASNKLFAFIWTAGPKITKGMYGMIDSDCDGVFEPLDIILGPAIPSCVYE